MANGRNRILIRHGEKLSQAFARNDVRPIENFELGYDVSNGALYIGVNDTYQAVGANFGQNVVLQPINGGLGKSINIEGNQIGFSYFNKNGGQVIFAEGAGTVYLTTEKDEDGNITSINVSHGILPPAAGGTGLSEILPNSFIYGGADGNLVSIAPGENTAGDIGFNAGVPFFERDDSNQTNSVKTGIVPLEFGGTGENFRNLEFGLGLFYLTSTTPEEKDNVTNRIFRTLTNPEEEGYSLLSFTAGTGLEWLQPPFVQKSDSANSGELMVYSGPTDGKDSFTTIDTSSGSSSGFLYYGSSSYTFRSIKEEDIVDLGAYLTSDDLNLNDYQLKIGATGILVGDGESVSSVTVDTSITGNTYLSYSGGKYSFVPIETGPTISGTGLLYGVSGADTPDQVEIEGASFPEKNSLVAIESSKITYLETLPLNYYNIPLETEVDENLAEDTIIWAIPWTKYNKKRELLELSSWEPTDGAVIKFFGLDVKGNFRWSSSLPTTTEVLPSNLKYAESGTASSIIGIADGTDQFIKVDPSTFGKTYTPGFGISIENQTISVNINGDSGVLWYWKNALRSYPISDKNNETSNLYLAAYDENKFMYRYNIGDGIVTLNNGIITLVSKEDIGGSDIVIGNGDGYLWKDGTGIAPTKNISGVTIGNSSPNWKTSFDTRYVTLAEVGTAGTSSKLLFMNNNGNIVSSSETIRDMPTITLPSGTQGGWVWMDEDGNLESRSIEPIYTLSQKGLLFTDSNDKLLEFYGTGTAGYLYTDANGNISISTPSSGGASYIAGDGISISGSTISVDLSDSDIPSLSASKITSGTFSYLRIRNSTKVFANNDGWKLCWVSNNNSTPQGSAFKTFAGNSTTGRSFSVLFIDDQGYIWY